VAFAPGQTSRTVQVMVNGDTSAINDADEIALDSFVDSLPNHMCIEYGEETFFSHFNDVDKLGNDCIEIKVIFEVRCD
jgi:hypothetical protein